MPKISVIIPVYNVEKYLRECLDSVVNQTFKDIEIICVDDGSTDSSLEILKEYAQKDNRFIILQQQNKGAGAARNAGLDIARGEYLSFLDSDDVFDLSMLKKMYDRGVEFNSDIVGCRASKFDSSTKKILNIFGINFKFIPNKDYFSFDEIKNEWSNVFIPAVWNKLYKTEFVRKNNLRFQNLKSCNDIGFSLCATAIASNFSVVRDVLLYYRKNTCSSISYSRGSVAINIILAYKHIVQFLKSHQREELIDCLNNSIKSNIEFEASNCNYYQLHRFKKQSKKILGSNWNTFKNYYKRHSLFSKILLNIFSIINTKNKSHKIITILGIKIKLKRKSYYKNKQIFDRFIRHNIKRKTVLLVELNQYHGECLPGMAKYFLDLDYNVEVLLNSNEAKLKPFSQYFKNKISVFCAEPKIIKSILCSDIIERYDYLYINSNRFKKQDISEYLGDGIKYPAGKIITMYHHAEDINITNFNTINFDKVFLAQYPILNGKQYKQINSHFFKPLVKHIKNRITKFIVVGNIEMFRKNHNILIKAVTELVEQDITDFRVIIISRIGNLDIPQNIKKYIELKVNLSYPKMYKEIEQSDFLLTLFDTENPEHNRYITSGSSGSYQLSYGFNIPVLIPHKFQCPINGFNNSNSIGYNNNNDFLNAMKSCINMDRGKYNEYKANLADLAQEIYNTSLNNLKEITDSKFDSKINLYISLGENCFNRVVLTRHHLKAKKSEGEKSLPFDLCVCPLKTVVYCLTNNFNNYFDNLKWDSKDNLWKNKQLRISYNHDIDCSDKDKNKLLKRYKGRIENFRLLLHDNTKKVFILSLIKPVEDDYLYINKIHNYINQNVHSECKLVVVNIAKEETLKAELLNSDILYKHIPHPYPHYWGEWFKGEYFNSTQGQAFEKEYINFIKQCTNDKYVKEDVLLCQS